jgi:hypothetical protein
MVSPRLRVGKATPARTGERVVTGVLNGTDAPAVARYAGDEVTMLLQTLGVILLMLWLLGNVSSYTLGGFIHVFLVVAIVMFVFRFLQGRRVA